LCTILGEEVKANEQKAVSFFRWLVTGLTAEFRVQSGTIL